MRHLIHARPFLLAITAASLALAGCKPPDPTAPSQPESATLDPSGIIIPISLPHSGLETTSKISLCVADAADPHQRVQINLLTDALRAASGYELAYADAKGSSATQVTQLRAIAATKPKAVMVLPVDAAAVKEEIANLREANVLVIGLDASLNDGTCDTVVFCDQKKIGSMAGELIVNALKRKAQDSGSTEITGRVVQIQGDEKKPASRARSDGFQAALKTQPGIVLVHDTPVLKMDKTDAALRFNEALKLQSSIDAVYAHNDMLALGVSSASVESKVRESLLIVGTDGVAGPGAGLEMIRKGQLDASIHQPLLVDFAWRIIEKMSQDTTFKPKPSYEIEPVAFTPKNLDELQASGLPVPSF